MIDNEQLAAEFAEHRPALVGAAYRVVGSMTDAEDVVQETWLRGPPPTAPRSATTGRT